MADPLQAIAAILPGSKQSCLLLSNVPLDASCEVLKPYPLMKLNVFLDDTKLHVWSRNQEVMQAVRENCDSSGTGGAMQLLASLGQHVVAPACPEECHE